MNKKIKKKENSDEKVAGEKIKKKEKSWLTLKSDTPTSVRISCTGHVSIMTTVSEMGSVT